MARVRRVAPTSITLSPELRDLLDRYARDRRISRSAAIEELILYVFDRSGCPANPRLIAQTIRMLRDEQSQRAED